MARKQESLPEETESVITREGHYEVDSRRMETEITQQDLTEEEAERIVAERWDYLAWMQDHFAEKVLPPTDRYETDHE